MAVCGRALSCNNRTPDDNSPRRLIRIAGFSSVLSISLYPTLFTVVPLSRSCSSNIPCESQKIVSITFLAEGWLLNFFFTGDPGYFHSMDWRLLSGAKWWTHVSSPLTIRVKNASPSLAWRSSRRWQMAKRLFFCSSVSSLGSQLAQTSRKPSLLWMMSYAEPWLI